MVAPAVKDKLEMVETSVGGHLLFLELELGASRAQPGTAMG